MVKNIAWTVEIILLVVVAFIYYLAQPVKVEKVVYIPQGSVVKIIAQVDKSKIPLSRLDRYFFRLFGMPQTGWIDFGTTTMRHADMLYKLSHTKAATRMVRLVPGETTYVFLKEVALVFSLDFDTLWLYYEKYTPFGEGYLIPETYQIPLGIDESRLIAILMAFAHEHHKKYAVELLGNYEPQAWYEYIKVASIIQKEAASIEEMPLVASVIYNRLAKGMRLQMDGTLNYGRYSHQKVTPYRIRNDESRYNTYRYSGLPPVPVCNVSIEAIKAAINPS